MNRIDGDTRTKDTFQSGELSPDDAFRVLAHRHRRIVVTSLLGTRHGVPVETLVDDVLVHADLPDDPAEARSRIATELHHAHLPRLADLGLVEWDREHGVVAPTRLLGALDPLVEGTTLARFYR